MAKEAKTLDDLFHDTLKDIYYAEKKILTINNNLLPTAGNAAATPHLAMDDAAALAMAQQRAAMAEEKLGAS